MKKLIILVSLSGLFTSCSHVCGPVESNKGVANWRSPAERAFIKDKYQEPIFNKRLKREKDGK